MATLFDLAGALVTCVACATQQNCSSKLLLLSCRTADVVHVSPAGVLAMASHITRPVLQIMLADAREFVADWLEMRPVFQHRLFGHCLRPPLQVLKRLLVLTYSERNNSFKHRLFGHCLRPRLQVITVP